MAIAQTSAHAPRAAGKRVAPIRRLRNGARAAADPEVAAARPFLYANVPGQPLLLVGVGGRARGGPAEEEPAAVVEREVAAHGFVRPILGHVRVDHELR